MIKCETCKKQFEGTIKKGNIYICQFCMGDGIAPFSHAQLAKTSRELRMEESMREMVIALEAFMEKMDTRNLVEGLPAGQYHVTKSVINRAVKILEEQ